MIRTIVFDKGGRRTLSLNFGGCLLSQIFEPGEFLVFQLESGFALMRLLAVDRTEAGLVWHVAVYGDFYPDVDTAEAFIGNPAAISVNSPHLALTDRAFESTQVAAIGNVPLTGQELEPLNLWRRDPTREVSDRSVRLMLGIR
jgi:hypothetical protein